MGKKGRKRRVEEAVIPGMGHFVAMEAPRACAETTAKWIDEMVDRWEKEEESTKSTWRDLNMKEKEGRANAWMARLESEALT